ncbi:hypothetical protein EYC80_004851 [Monilinia laxa]|uniref:Uncharacterized protein n=1 Tax=Monilinia laxa TaxID=61186 RepID=A0A5N6KIA8_MONLA|nr:hypothetical protein EYC80_004851 [Monilinia laxa]
MLLSLFTKSPRNNLVFNLHFDQVEELSKEKDKCMLIGTFSQTPPPYIRDAPKGQSVLYIRDFPVEGLMARHYPRHSRTPLHQVRTWASITHLPFELRSNGAILLNHPDNYYDLYRHQSRTLHQVLVWDRQLLHRR